MKLTKPTADIFIPSNDTLDAALQTVTHLGVGAHQDDLEFMAFHGILQCYETPGDGFCGVTCTDGAGSPRAGVYANHTDADMRLVRRKEQKNAAQIGHYKAMFQLDFASRELKDGVNPAVVADLTAILSATRPRVVYTHNPADRHSTHVAVMRHVLHALRGLLPEYRPEAFYGCESWRGLDWMPQSRTQVLDVGSREHLAASLYGVYDSQIAGGKRYDLAHQGRNRANATMFASHGVDTMTAASYAMDLMPLLRDPTLALKDYVGAIIDDFKNEVLSNLRRNP
jgi:LmbE family N-acetylglucosaminyl deacetylase